MLKVLSCIAYEHDYRGLLLASVICVAGAVLTTRLVARTHRATGTRRATWLFLSGVVCGSAIWTTHFVAMLGFQPPVDHAYDTIVTLISLVVAIGASTLGLMLVASTRASPLVEVGGAVVGLGVAAMHFTGMAAYRVGGHIEWDMTLVVFSVVSAAFFGALATNRIVRPVTRFCKHGGMLALVLAIVTMHFTAMGAATILPDPSIMVPPRAMSDEMMAIAVIGVMSLVMGTGLAGYLIDSQNQEEAVQRYRHLAMHDATTGLPNRAYLSARLAEKLARAKGDTSRVAIIAIDLDRFKDVNDVHGHASGDLVLKTLAERLSARLGKGEFIARVGGDEFVAVKQDAFTIGQAHDFANNLLETIREPITDGERIFTVGASLGLTVYPDDGGEAEQLLGRADLAMYRAKQSAADKVCRYDSSMDETSRARAALAMELRHAVERDELELYYQPQTDVMTRRLLGYEALLRWNHPERGLVSPVDFIPLAEETGLILPIGEWVLRTACAEAARWILPLKIAVNVAPAQVAQGNLATLVHETLLATGLAAARLELEITESSIIGDHQHALHVIRQLKALGVTIAMDDYGTGYSSLSTLQTFPFDKIKIDRSFVNAVTTSEQASAIVRSTIILANSLNIPVLAEGVESCAHLAFLRDQGCHEAQGYLFGRPLPVASIREHVGGLGDAAPRPAAALPAPPPEPAPAPRPLRKAS